MRQILLFICDTCTQRVKWKPVRLYCNQNLILWVNATLERFFKQICINPPNLKTILSCDKVFSEIFKAQDVLLIIYSGRQSTVLSKRCKLILQWLCTCRNIITISDFYYLYQVTLLCTKLPKTTPLCLRQVLVVRHL